MEKFILCAGIPHPDLSEASMVFFLGAKHITPRLSREVPYFAHILFLPDDFILAAFLAA